MILKRFKYFFLNKVKCANEKQTQMAAKRSVENKIIEFVGVSGIGKSTLFYLSREKLTAQWEYCIPHSDFEDILFEKGLREIHWNLLENKLLNVKNMTTDIIRKLQLTSYFNKILLDNLKLIEMNSQKGFFIEEGLCHNFSKELQELDDEELKIILKNRFLIYVKTNDPLRVVQQIKKRTSEGGHIVYHHVGLSDNQLLELVVKSMEQFESFFKRIVQISVPFCTIMIEDGLEINSNKIIEFEKQF